MIDYVIFSESAIIGEWHEYYSVTNPELAAALATYKEST